jgi:hypothetical protein
MSRSLVLGRVDANVENPQFLKQDYRISRNGAELKVKGLLHQVKRI